MVFKTITIFKFPFKRNKGKSRRDGTLLTVGFNLRKLDDIRTLPSPAGTTHIKRTKCRPCGTWHARMVFPVRRLKSTVNKVLSLRDISPLTQSLGKRKLTDIEKAFEDIEKGRVAFINGPKKHQSVLIFNKNF